MRRTLVLVAIVSGMIATMLLGCGASYEQAKVRGSNINSMMAIRDVSIALERYRHDHGTYPMANTMAELQKAVAPLLDHVQSTDRWGEPLVVEVTNESYTVTSKGDDRTGGHEFGGAVSIPGHSITMKDAVFVQFDASVERTARKFEAEIAEVRNQSPKGV
jgi:hypothetical protein